jgi:hypothetical protein
MRGGKTLILWLSTAALCSTAFVTAQALHWPLEKDTFAQLRNSLAALEARLPQDSAVSIRIEGMADDHFNYLRYLLIPRPLELSLPATRRMILLASTKMERLAFERMKRQRPDLQCVLQVREKDYCLALFTPVR